MLFNKLTHCRGERSFNFEHNALTIRPQKFRLKDGEGDTFNDNKTLLKCKIKVEILNNGKIKVEM
jgi:hypothetical protein